MNNACKIIILLHDDILKTAEIGFLRSFEEYKGAGSPAQARRAVGKGAQKVN